MADNERRLTSYLESLNTDQLERLIDRAYSLLRRKTTNPVRARRAVARDIITFLNQRAGRNFDVNNTANLELVEGRLKQGYSEQTIKQVTAMMCRKWKDTDMEPYLRPATLYSRTKFAQYHGYLGTTEAHKAPETDA